MEITWQDTQLKNNGHFQKRNKWIKSQLKLKKIFSE